MRKPPKKSKPRRVLGYARVSSEEQTKGTSLEDQRRAISKHAKSLGMDVHEFYVEAESGGRGRIEHRAEMRRLMSDVQAGDLVVVAKLDRWSRDPAFSYSSIDKIVATGADLYLIAEACGPHDDNWDTIFGVHALVARLEHKRIRERLVGTRHALRDDGYFSEGPVPIGYKRQGRSTSPLAIVEREAATVRECFARALAGESQREVAAAVRLSQQSVRRILHRRMYIGEIQDSEGQWIAGKHPAIVDADLFARVQDVMATRQRTATGPRGGGATTSWILRDVARCIACGRRCASVYGGRKRADGTYPSYFYRCAAKCSPGVRVEAAESIAEPLIVARLEELRAELARPPSVTKPTAAKASTTERRAQLAKKRDRYVEAYSDGALTREEMRAKLAKCDADLLRLDAEERAVKRASPLVDPAVRRAALASIVTIRRAWSAARPEGRRKIVRRLAEEARIGAGRVVFVWRSAEIMATLRV